MNRFELISQIKKYKVFNEQEEKDKYLLLEWIMDNEDAFSREKSRIKGADKKWQEEKKCVH